MISLDPELKKFLTDTNLIFYGSFCNSIVALLKFLFLVQGQHYLKIHRKGKPNN